MSREFSRYHVEWRSVGLGGLVVVAGCGLLAGCGAPGDAADGLDGDDARQEEAASMDAPRPPPAESLMHGDTLVDMRDGRDYATVLIREQRWMAGNLRYQPPDASGWFCYDDDPLLCEELGALYAWNTARSACPPGWHLPTESEWDRLVDGVGGYTERTGEPGAAAAALAVDGESGLGLALVGLRTGAASAARGRMALYWTSSYSNIPNRWELAERAYGDRAEEMVDTYVMGRHLYRGGEGWVLEPSTAPTVGFEPGGLAVAASVRCVAEASDRAPEG